MNSKFLFSIADPADDAELRAVVRRVPMPGKISLAFHREPSFFAAERLGCIKSETIICRKSDSGNVIGFGGRSLWRLFIGGKETTMWYLHTLRLIPEERKGIALMRGYQYFRSMKNESAMPYFFTTILDGNIPAKKVLESGRAGMPVYTKAGTLKTYLVPLRKKISKPRVQGDITRATILEIKSACESINDWNAKHELATVYHPEDLIGWTGKLPNFSYNNLYLSSVDGKITGTLGVWDQQTFKQSVVDSYSIDMRVARVASNAWSYVRGLPYLPKSQGRINIVHASLLSVLDNNHATFKSLLDRAVADWSGRGYDWLAVGLCSSHPLESVIKKMSARELSSGIYYVHWDENNVILPDTHKLFHLETASL